MKHYILALAIMLSGLSSVFGQSITDKLGVGFNLGGQLLYGDGSYDPGLGIGLETYLKYKMNERFDITTALGYGELSDGTFHLDKSNFTTNIITLDLKGSVNFAQNNPFKPFAYLGLGAFSFKNDLYDKRFGDFSLFLGGG